MLAAGYHVMPQPDQKQASVKPRSVIGKATRRDMLETSAWCSGSYSVKVITGLHKCPGCEGQHSLTRRNGEIRPSSRLKKCKEVHGQITPLKKSRMLGEVRECQLCTSWKHILAKCHLSRKGFRGGVRQEWTCGVETGTSTCNEVHNNSLQCPSLRDAKY